MTTTAKTIVIDKKLAAFDSLLDGVSRCILINNVSWEEYEFYLEVFAERAGWRLAYDGGKLEFMPPTPIHEEYSFSFLRFVIAYCEFFDLTLEGRGSTTFRSEILKKGVEPDECFYVQTAKRIIGKTFKKGEFPMPDVAVEIDITTESLKKFPIYAALEVPELWVYDGETLAFYELDGEQYQQIPHSRALPQLSALELGNFLEMSKKQGQTTALKSFRESLNKE